MPELQDLARQALEKARLFGEGFAGDIGQQLTQTPDKLRSLLEPSASPVPMPPQVEAGMKLMSLLPDIDQATSTGLGSAGVAGGKDMGFYKPDSPLGELSLGPRELGASAIGMVLPTGKLAKAGKVEQIAAKAEQNLARVLERMGPGAQRLAAKSAERGPLPKIEAKAAQALSPEAGGQSVMESFANEVSPEGRDTRRPFEKFGPGARRLDEAAQERYRANPPATQTKVLKEAPEPVVEIDPHRETARRILAGERPDQGGLLFTNYDTGKTEQLGEGLSFRDELGVPSTTEAKQELGNLRYRTGIQNESVFAPKDAPASLPEGTEKLNVAPGTDIISQDLRPDGSPWTERNVRTMPAMDEQTGKPMEPSFLPGDKNASMVPEVSAGKAQKTDTQQLEAIKDLESQIGNTWSGSRQASGMERDRLFKRHQPVMEQYIRDELEKAGGDIWQTTAVKDAIREPALSRQPIYKNGKKQYDADGNVITYPSFRERIEEALDKDPENRVRVHQQNVKPMGVNFTKRSVAVDPETGEKIAVPGGWETTPEGEKFLLAEAKAMLTGKKDPQEWAEDALRNKARAYARMNDPENPESVRHWSKKRDPSDTRDASEGVVADDWSEFYNAGEQDLIEAERQGIRDRPRELDERSRGRGNNAIVFDSDEQEKSYRKLTAQFRGVQRVMDDPKSSPGKRRWAENKQNDLDDQISDILEPDRHATLTGDEKWSYRKWQAGEMEGPSRRERDTIDPNDVETAPRELDPEAREKQVDTELAIREAIEKGMDSESIIGMFKRPSDQGTAKRLIEDYAYKQKTSAPQPEKPVGTKKNKRGYATGTRQEGEREATGEARGYRSPDNPVQKMAEIVDAVNTVRRGAPATSAQRGVWETYMQKRMAEMLQGMR